jgi:hypothetical protein
MRRGVCAGHRRGYKKRVGRVGGGRGRETRQRVRVCTRWSTAGARKAELIGLAHGVEREERVRGGNGSAIGSAGPQDRERKRARGPRKTGADRLGPLGSEREREGVRERELPLTGGVRLSGAAGARPGGA